MMIVIVIIIIVIKCVEMSRRENQLVLMNHLCPLCLLNLHASLKRAWDHDEQAIHELQVHV